MWGCREHPLQQMMVEKLFSCVEERGRTCGLCSAQKSIQSVSWILLNNSNSETAKKTWTKPLKTKTQGKTFRKDL